MNTLEADWEEVTGWFREDDVPPPDRLLIAEYTSATGYDGYAFVLFERDGTLYEVNGSHCSCFGLEEQWYEEVTAWEMLLNREFRYWETPIKEQVRRLYGES